NPEQENIFFLAPAEILRVFTEEFTKIYSFVAGQPNCAHFQVTYLENVLLDPSYNKLFKYMGRRQQEQQSHVNHE
uniref:Uncharacterized protein n=1 Tax=Glossina palpalis gambiensis TaxID=67801 RepID=A0A1B0BK57_9MUSC